jgi:hypothetical protein
MGFLSGLFMNSDRTFFYLCAAMCFGFPVSKKGKIETFPIGEKRTLFSGGNRNLSPTQFSGRFEQIPKPSVKSRTRE